MVGRGTAPKKGKPRILILGARDSSSHGKGDSAGVMKDLCEEISWFCWGPNIITRVLVRGRWESQRKKWQQKQRSEREVGRHHAAGLTMERRGHEPRNMSGFEKLGKAQKQTLP